MLLKIKTFGFQKNCTRWEKNLPLLICKIVNLKKIYTFTLKYFLIGHIVYILIVKNVIKNEKFFFTPNLCEIQKKCLERRLFALKRSKN